MGITVYKNLHLLLVFKKQKQILNIAVQDYLKQEARNKAIVLYKNPNTSIVPFIKQNLFFGA